MIADDDDDDHPQHENLSHAEHVKVHLHAESQDTKKRL
jgi:hypothetical protein